MLERFLKIFLLSCWTLLVARLLVLPMPDMLPDYSFTYDDKLVHLVLFGVFLFLILEVMEAFLAVRYRYLVASALLITFAYAQALEYIQQFIPGRTASIYDTIAGLIGGVIAIIVIYFLDYKQFRKPRMLLHICCIGCGAYVSQVLKKDYRLTLYFYNPNIFPESEYHLRLKETRRVARKFGLKVLVGKYRHNDWLTKIKGHEHEPERGGRCVICYRDRLEATAHVAHQFGYDYFTSTLTVSPHKLAAAINQIGQELEKEYQVKFLVSDFKKQDGFKKSLALSRELGLYRQDYCGCEFSMKAHEGVNMSGPRVQLADSVL